MLFLPLDLDPFAAGADEILQRRVEVQAVAHLVEIGHLKVGALANLAGRCGDVGLQFAKNELEQRGLASTIRAKQADLVASQQRATEAVDDELFKARMAEALADVGQFRNDLATFLAARKIQIDTAHGVATSRAVVAQGFEPTDARDAAGPARFDALANPHFLLRQQLVGLGVDDRLLRRLLFLLNQIPGEVARVAQQLAAIELDDDCRHLIKKSPVVSDRDNAAVEVDQQVFQPGN